MASLCSTRPRTLLGRETELEQLRRCWERVRSGVGQVVLVSGEAGIGKSHLVAAFRRAIHQSDVLWLEAPSSPYLRASAFHPILRGLAVLLVLSSLALLALTWRLAAMLTTAATP